MPSAAFLRLESNWNFSACFFFFPSLCRPPSPALARRDAPASVTEVASACEAPASFDHTGALFLRGNRGAVNAGAGGKELSWSLFTLASASPLPSLSPSSFPHALPCRSPRTLAPRQHGRRAPRGEAGLAAQARYAAGGEETQRRRRLAFFSLTPRLPSLSPPPSARRVHPQPAPALVPAEERRLLPRVRFSRAQERERETEERERMRAASCWTFFVPLSFSIFSFFVPSSFSTSSALLSPAGAALLPPSVSRSPPRPCAAVSPPLRSPPRLTALALAPPAATRRARPAPATAPSTSSTLQVGERQSKGMEKEGGRGKGEDNKGEEQQGAKGGPRMASSCRDAGLFFFCRAFCTHAQRPLGPVALACLLPATRPGPPAAPWIRRSRSAASLAAAA